MTENKPIMIGGVDVSKCKFFKIKDCDEIETPYICGIEYPKDAFIINAPDLCCEQNPNCLFKQLARKTQELEQLQKDYLLDHRDDDENTIPLIQQIRDRLDLVDELETECEELNKTITNLENIRDEFSTKLDQLKAENKELKANNEKWKTIDITFNNGVAKTQILDLSLAEYSKLKLEKDRAEQKLEKIKEFATALCYKVMSDGVVVLQEDILQIIDEVE